MGSGRRHSSGCREAAIPPRLERGNRRFKSCHPDRCNSGKLVPTGKKCWSEYVPPVSTCDESHNDVGLSGEVLVD